jgi:hypothetical protein
MFTCSHPVGGYCPQSEGTVAKVCKPCIQFVRLAYEPGDVKVSTVTKRQLQNSYR